MRIRFSAAALALALTACTSNGDRGSAPDATPGTGIHTLGVCDPVSWAAYSSQPTVCEEACRVFPGGMAHGNACKAMLDDGTEYDCVFDTVFTADGVNGCCTAIPVLDGEKFVDTGKFSECE